jgi:purine-cytosine permease-like protein
VKNPETQPTAEFTRMEFSTHAKKSVFLLLLGFLMTITTILLGVFLPETGRLVIALLIPVIVLVFLGVICLAIGFVAKLVKSESKDQPPA